MRLILAILTVLVALALSGVLAAGPTYAPRVAETPDATVSAWPVQGDDEFGPCSHAAGQCGHDRCEAGKCACSICGGAGIAIYSTSNLNLLFALAGAWVTAMPEDSLRDGLTVRPITGPPRVFA
jgi:hypothetical protein